MLRQGQNIIGSQHKHHTVRQREQRKHENHAIQGDRKGRRRWYRRRRWHRSRSIRRHLKDQIHLGSHRYTVLPDTVGRYQHGRHSQQRDRLIRGLVVRGRLHHTNRSRRTGHRWRASGGMNIRRVRITFTGIHRYHRDWASTKSIARLRIRILRRNSIQIEAQRLGGRRNGRSWILLRRDPHRLKSERNEILVGKIWHSKIDRRHMGTPPAQAQARNQCRNSRGRRSGGRNCLGTWRQRPARHTTWGDILQRPAKQITLQIRILPQRRLRSESRLRANRPSASVCIVNPHRRDIKLPRRETCAHPRPNTR